MDPRERLRTVHQAGGKEGKGSAPSVPKNDARLKETKVETTPKEVETTPKEVETLHTEDALALEKTLEELRRELEIVKEQLKKKETESQHENITYTPIKQIARDDVPLERYRKKAFKSNFNIYNQDIVDFVRNFSKENQDNHGNAITKSQLFEVLLDVVYYDIQLRAYGFESAHDLRWYLQEKLRLN